MPVVLAVGKCIKGKIIFTKILYEQENNYGRRKEHY